MTLRETIRLRQGTVLRTNKKALQDEICFPWDTEPSRCLTKKDSPTVQGTEAASLICVFFAGDVFPDGTHLPSPVPRDAALRVCFHDIVFNHSSSA